MAGSSRLSSRGSPGRNATVALGLVKQPVLDYIHAVERTDPILVSVNGIDRDSREQLVEAIDT